MLFIAKPEKQFMYAKTECCPEFSIQCIV